MTGGSRGNPGPGLHSPSTTGGCGCGIYTPTERASLTSEGSGKMQHWTSGTEGCGLRAPGR